MANEGKLLTVEDLVRGLEQEGLLAPAGRQAIEACFSDAGENDLPLYLRALVGVGAFVACACFVGFLSVTHLINFDGSGDLIVLGLFCVIAAIAADFLCRHPGSVIAQSFIVQVSFCFMMLGKFLFVMGVAWLFKYQEGWGITIGALLITVATYPIYRVSLDRCLSPLFTLASVFFNLISPLHGHGLNPVLINLFIIVQVVLAGFLFMNGRMRRMIVPIAYALAFSICIAIVFVDFGLMSSAQASHFDTHIINAALVIALITLIARLAGSAKESSKEPLLAASLLVVLIGLVSAAGVILSICFMVLGYGIRERPLLLLGTLLLPVFLVGFYYNLDLNLMAKSGALTGAGVLLLGARSYMGWRKLDRAVQS